MEIYAIVSLIILWYSFRTQFIFHLFAVATQSVHYLWPDNYAAILINGAFYKRFSPLFFLFCSFYCSLAASMTFCIVGLSPIRLSPSLYCNIAWTQHTHTHPSTRSYRCTIYSVAILAVADTFGASKKKKKSRRAESIETGTGAGLLYVWQKADDYDDSVARSFFVFFFSFAFFSLHYWSHA